MMIRCIRCKEQFEQKCNERFCGCAKYNRKKKTSWPHHHYDAYMGNLRKYFQNPRYQEIRLNNSENISSSMHSLRKTKKIIIPNKFITVV